jgi:thioredoxin reductase (NADPH)
MDVRTAEPRDLPETPDADGAFPRLSDDQIGELSRYGERRATRQGDVLFRQGDERYDFIVVLSGKVAIHDGADSHGRLIAVHGPRRFLGELSLLTGQAAFFTAQVVEAGEVLVVGVDGLRDVVARDAALGDLVLRAYIQRRWMLIGLGAGLKIIGSRFSPDTRRLREFAARNRLPHRWIDLEEDPAAESLLRKLHVGAEETPIVIWRGTDVLRNPSNRELARILGMDAPAPPETTCDLLVVGTGPAGLAASVYGSSEGLATVAVEAVATGGQAGTSSRIENYLGFPAGISGAELADRAVIQAERFGAAIHVPCEATSLERGDGDHVVHFDDGASVSSRTVVIATGARYRKLDVPRLDEFEGVGVYYAATPMEVDLCRGDPVAVVGGGNSAGQAALFLAEHTSVVRVVIRHDDLSRDMSRYLVDRIERHPKIEVVRGAEVAELVGDRRLESIVLRDRATGERGAVPARAVFVFIGADPHPRGLGDELLLDEKGFILTGRDAAPDALPLETSRPGVFAVGDVRSGSIKRMASAVGEGSMAVRLVHEYLADHHRTQLPVHGQAHDART